MRDDKVNMLLQIAENRATSEQIKKDTTRFYKQQEKLLKKVSKKLKEDGIGSKGFGQCLRTCASSDAFVATMMEEEGEKSLAGGVEQNPETTFTTTVTINIDINDFIAPAGEDDDTSVGTFGNDSLTVSSSLLTDYVDYVKMDPHNPDANGLAQLSVDSYQYTLDSMSYSAKSPGGRSYPGGSYTGIKVRPPKLKKLGAGFLMTGKKTTRRKQGGGAFDIVGAKKTIAPQVKVAPT